MPKLYEVVTWGELCFSPTCWISPFTALWEVSPAVLSNYKTFLVHTKTHSIPVVNWCLQQNAAKAMRMLSRNPRGWGMLLTLCREGFGQWNVLSLCSLAAGIQQRLGKCQPLKCKVNWESLCSLTPFIAIAIIPMKVEQRNVLVDNALLKCNTPSKKNLSHFNPRICKIL